MSQVTITLSPSLAERFRRFMSALGNDRAVERFLSYEEKRLRQEVAGMRADLTELEQRHGMDSDTFYARFSEGTLGDGSEFILWAGLVEMLRDSEHRLREIQ